jgi:CBS domain-containing protein
MKLVGNINAVLKVKGTQAWSVAPGATVYEAIQLMSERNVGALLVMEGDRLEGLVSERDYTRKVVLRGRSSKETAVRDIISKPVITVTPDHTVENCMRLMTDKRVRHLPVIDKNRVVGVVSIGDLVNWIISVQSVAIDQLEHYITGQYPA